MLEFNPGFEISDDEVIAAIQSVPEHFVTDLSITATLVALVQGDTLTKNAGATITAGQVLYLDTATDTWKLADGNGASQLIRTAKAIALNGAASGQPVVGQLNGIITIGGTVAAGTNYLLSGTPGAIGLMAPGTTDLVTGIYPQTIGVGLSATLLRLSFFKALDAAGADVAF